MNIESEYPGWYPIATAPRTGEWVMLAAPSGYKNPPLRAEVCCYNPEYRPLQPWINHARDSFMDGGQAPTLWRPLTDHSEYDHTTREDSDLVLTVTSKSGEWFPVLPDYNPIPGTRANAERIAACVNACAGYDTVALQGGGIGYFHAAVREMIEAIKLKDTALEACEPLVTTCAGHSEEVVEYWEEFARWVVERKK